MKKWLYLLFGLIAFPLLVGILIAPLWLKSVMEHQVLQTGAQSAVIGRVRLDWFQGRMSLHDIHLAYPGNHALKLDQLKIHFSWNALRNKRILIHEVSLSGLGTDVSYTGESGLTVAGQTLPEKSEESAASVWPVGIETITIKRSHASVFLLKQGYDLEISSLGLKGLVPWRTLQKTHLEYSGTINRADVRLQAELPLYQNGQDYTATAEINDLSMADIKAFVPGFESVSGRGDLQASISWRVENGQPLTMTQKAKYRLRQPEFSLRKGTQSLIFAAESLSFSSDESYEIGKKTRWQIKGGAEIKDLAIKTVDQDMLLLGLHSAQIGSLRLESEGKAGMEDLSLVGLSLLRQDADQLEPLLERGTLLVGKAEFVHDGMALDDIKITDGAFHLTRTDKGWQRLVHAEPILRGLEGSTSKKDRQPYWIAMNHIVVQDGLQIVFNDKTSTPPVQLNGRIKRLSLDRVNNSEAESFSRFELDGKIQQYGALHAAGDIQPFNPNLTATLHARISAVDLPVFSPYIAAAMGVRVRSGQLNANMDLAVRQGKLDGNSDLILQQLKLDELSEVQKQQYAQGAEFSLSRALDVLRDKNNRIKLTIPISGDIHAPDFSMRDAINQAALKASKMGVMKYLTQSLQPYGSLITVVQFAGKQLAKIRLKPVEFLSGQTDLDEGSSDYLGKVAAILQEKPKVAISLCGYATPSEIEAPGKDVDVRTVLEKLARKRAENIRDYLVRKLNVKVTQLVSCLPEIDSSENAVPRVELYL